jgi:hypothetical protein
MTPAAAAVLQPPFRAETSPYGLTFDMLPEKTVLHPPAAVLPFEVRAMAAFYGVTCQTVRENCRQFLQQGTVFAISPQGELFLRVKHRN